MRSLSCRELHVLSPFLKIDLMKKIAFIILFLVSVTIAANAQFAFEGGLNMANMSLKVKGTSVGTGFKNAAAMGFVNDVEVGNHVYFQHGLLYEMMGCKLTDPKGEYTLHTIGFPLNLMYKSKNKCDKRFFIGAGLNLGYNISGSYSTEADEKKNIPSTSGTLKFGSDAPLKKVDLRTGLNFGYMLSRHFYFRVSYQFSIANLDKSESKDNVFKTSAIGIRLGYSLGRCRVISYATTFRRTENTHWRGMSKGVFSRNRKNGYKVHYKQP